MKLFTPALWTVLLFSSAELLFGQSFLLQLPTTQDEANRMVKNVEEQSIPNQPGLVYEEIRVARQKSEEYESAASRTLPDSLRPLESVKGTVQQTLANWRQLAKDCAKGGEAAELKRQLQQSAGPFGFDFEMDNQNFRTEVKRLLTIPSKDLCKTLASDQEIAALTKASETDTEKARQLYTQQIAFAGQLQKAWSARLTKLEKLQTEQLQTYDLQKMVPYLVGIVCLFAVAMFYGLTKYNHTLQMELITSGQMIQFPTVMILLVIIVALAIPKTISENTVSALLGGIAGYVLSQGVGRAVAREAERRAGIPAGTGTATQTDTPTQTGTLTAPAQTAQSTNRSASRDSIPSHTPGS